MISEAYTLYLSKISKEEMSEFKEIILGYTSTRKLDDVINEGYETEELNSIDLEEDKQNQLNSSSDLDLFDDINLSGINKKIKKSDQPSEYIVKGEVSSEEDSIDDISEEEEIKTKILDDFHSLFDDNKTSAIDFNFHTDKEASTLYYSNKIHTIPRVDFPENNLHGTNT
jgi:SPX domain protein involved in polyphosphate accumulation